MAEVHEVTSPAPASQASRPEPSSSAQKSAQDTLNQPQVPAFPGLPSFPSSEFQKFPVIFPAFVPVFAPVQNEDQLNRGAGLYAVPVLPHMVPIAGFQPNTLIPLTYDLPTARASPGSGSANAEHGQAGQQQHPAAQRQAVRRFPIVFQLDLLLIFKLAAVIFLFNQDGSRQRLIVLVFFASLVYLYQTGALTPLVRWLSQGMQRAAVPPHPRPAVRADNALGAGGPANENVAVAEGQAGAENANRPAEVGNLAAENENVIEPGAGNAGNRWWGIVKEVQMIIFGFITSLLPGFQNID